MSGSHRGRPRRLRAAAPAIIASLVAVLIVVGAIVVVDVLHHRSSSSSVSSAVTSPVSSPVATAASPVSSPVSTPTTVAPSTPRPTPAKKKPAPPRTPAPVATPAPRSTPVAVYNNSRVARRAELAASRLRADGYPVSHTATRPAYPGSDVVYFPPGDASLAAAARGLVARHLGIVSAAPRPASIPASAGLIVVVGAAYR